MNAQEVIEQINTLPLEERMEVLKYVRALASGGGAPSAEKPRKDVKPMIEKIFAAHDELFRKLAQ